jgi:CRP-like cAMP-binding protein
VVSKKERTEALGQVPMFSALSKKQLANAAGHVTWTARPEGTVLIDQGSIAKQLLILVEGTAKVVRSKRTLANLGPGDVIGEMSLINPAPSTATVTATSDVTLLALSTSDFWWLITNEANFAKNVLKQVAARLRDADSKIIA